VTHPQAIRGGDRASPLRSLGGSYTPGPVLNHGGSSECPLRCRRKGQWRIRLFGSSNQTLACCTCLSHRSRYTTALTNRRPQSYSELGEDGPGRARYKNARLCERPPAALATLMASAGVSGLWPMPPARASAASGCVGCAARLGSMRLSLAPQCQTRRVWQGPGSGALRHPARHAAPILE
jgi:hypothetical protein